MKHMVKNVKLLVICYMLK